MATAVIGWRFCGGQYVYVEHSQTIRETIKEEEGESYVETACIKFDLLEELFHTIEELKEDLLQLAAESWGNSGSIWKYV